MCDTAGCAPWCARLTLALSVLAITLSDRPVRAQILDSVDLPAVKDNTLYEDPFGAISNGAGQNVFAGRVDVTGQGRLRRGLMAFDLAGAVPAEATLTGAILTLNMNGTTAEAQTIELHRVLEDWGEAASNAPNNEGQGAAAFPDDATWLHTFWFSSTWSTPGGVFEPAASASQVVDQNAYYSWSSPELVADAQYFREHPDSNFGWILIGNETTLHTTKHFATRQHPLTLLRPVLRLIYALPCPVQKTGDLNTDGVLTSADIIGMVNYVFKGGATPQPCAATADVNCSGSVTSADIIAMVNHVFKGGAAPCDVCTLIPGTWSCP